MAIPLRLTRARVNPPQGGLVLVQDLHDGLNGILAVAVGLSSCVRKLTERR